MKRLGAVLIGLTLACGGKKDDPPPAPAPAPAPVPAKKPPPEAPDPTVVPAGSNKNPPPPPEAPEGNPPLDGKYEKVSVEGKTVPMIQVMNGGTVVLVDTDGKKPRSWEEQYKKKGSIKKGQFDIHKTDANHNGKFDDDDVDRQGLWVIDDKGNITQH
jgi:hypothetical protein